MKNEVALKKAKDIQRLFSRDGQKAIIRGLKGAGSSPQLPRYETVGAFRFSNSKGMLVSIGYGTLKGPKKLEIPIGTVDYIIGYLRG